MTDETMTEAEFLRYMEKAGELSQYFREIGPKYDAENTFAYPTITKFKESGIGAIAVPKRYGGAGGNMLQTSKIISELSRGDSAIALSYNMHIVQVGICLGLLNDEQKKQWMSRIVDGELVFGPISEPRAGFSGLADVKAIPQPNGGWKLYGKKNWGTLAEAASIITTNATITDAEGNMPSSFDERVAAETFFIADFNLDENGQGDGVRLEKTWNALGMHATGTHTIVFDGFFIPEDGYVCTFRFGAFGVLEWASLTFASIYLGMQYRILEETRAVLAKKTLGATFGASIGDDIKVATIGHIIDGVGHMASQVELSRRVVYQTCREVVDGDDKQWPAQLRFPYIGLAKTFVAQNVMDMARNAMSMVGGSSFRNGSIFERLYRDASASLFQPLNADQTNAYIGQVMLAPADSAG